MGASIRGRQPDLDVARDAALAPVFTKKGTTRLEADIRDTVRRTIYPIKAETARSSSPSTEERSKRVGSLHPCEVELELKRGESAELSKLARMLAEEVPVQLAVKSKASTATLSSPAGRLRR